MRTTLRWAAATLALFFAYQVSAEAQWTWTPQTKRWVNIKRMPKETAELQVEYARSLMLAGEYKKAIRETNKFDAYYGDTELADENQFLRGEIRQAQGETLDAAREYQQVVTNFPTTDRYDDVIAKQYEIGDYFYDRGVANQQKGWWRPFRERPFKRAIVVYGMVIDNEPFTDRAAEAQYKLGLCHFTLEEYVEAAYEYTRVIEDYSASEWVDEASYGLAQVHYAASLPPNYDQVPSELAVSAVDDFKARFPDDSRNAELAEIRTEMRNRIAEHRLRVAEFYEKRRKFQAAQISYEVVVEQFPETPAADEARAWLETNASAQNEIPAEKI